MRGNFRRKKLLGKRGIIRLIAIAILLSGIVGAISVYSSGQRINHDYTVTLQTSITLNAGAQVIVMRGNQTIYESGSGLPSNNTSNPTSNNSTVESQAIVSQLPLSTESQITLIGALLVVLGIFSTLTFSTLDKIKINPMKNIRMQFFGYSSFITMFANTILVLVALGYLLIGQQNSFPWVFPSSIALIAIGIAFAMLASAEDYSQPRISYNEYN